MSAGHTSGPWRVANGTYHGFESSDIATVYCTERVPTEDGMGANHVTIVGGPAGEDYQREQTANARLISAAPELLRVAELVEKAYLEGPYNTFHTRLQALAGGSFALTLGDALDKVRRAS